MAKALILNTVFSQRQKRMLGVVVWDFKGGRKAVHMEQMFGKQIFARPGRDNGTQSGL